MKIKRENIKQIIFKYYDETAEELSWNICVVCLDQSYFSMAVINIREKKICYQRTDKYRM